MYLIFILLLWAVVGKGAISGIWHVTDDYHRDR